MASQSVCACTVLFLLQCFAGVNSQLGQCTNGFFQDINSVVGVSRVVALPSADRTNLDFVQWIFPFLRFTCRGNITRWRVRVEEIDLDFREGDLARWNVPQLATWRETEVSGPQSPFKPMAYERVSITNDTLQTVTIEGSVYEYILPIPTEVEPGDTVGITLPINMDIRLSRTTKPLLLELVSGNSSLYSHIKLDNATVVVIPPAQVVLPVQTFIPLISVQIESSEHQCTTGFLTDITNTGGEPVGLPSEDRPRLDFVQWVFPFMTFSCKGKIIRWVLRIEPRDLDLEEDDRWNLPQISTWRMKKNQGFSTAPVFRYELASVTNETLSTKVNRGSVYEYDLSKAPVVVESGDIVGIQTTLNMRERLSRSTKLLFWQLVKGNTSTLSYSSLQNRSTIVISPYEIVEPTLTFIPLISVHFEPLDARKVTEAANQLGTTNVEGEQGDSETLIASITVTIIFLLMLVMTVTTVIAAVVICYPRCRKKKDKTSNQLHHTSPIYDTIPDALEPNNGMTTSREVILRQAKVLGRREQNERQPSLNHHLVGSTRHLEGHRNVIILKSIQRGRQSIETRENEAYIYALADASVNSPVQETIQENEVNESYPGKKTVENYIYPVTEKWVHIAQKD